jgi:hypothetical protein
VLLFASGLSQAGHRHRHSGVQHKEMHSFQRLPGLPATLMLLMPFAVAAQTPSPGEAPTITGVAAQYRAFPEIKITVQFRTPHPDPS